MQSRALTRAGVPSGGYPRSLGRAAGRPTSRITKEMAESIAAALPVNLLTYCGRVTVTWSRPWLRSLGRAQSGDNPGNVRVIHGNLVAAAAGTWSRGRRQSAASATVTWSPKPIEEDLYFFLPVVAAAFLGISSPAAIRCSAPRHSEGEGGDQHTNPSPRPWEAPTEEFFGRAAQR